MLKSEPSEEALLQMKSEFVEKQTILRNEMTAMRLAIAADHKEQMRLIKELKALEAAIAEQMRDLATP